MKQFSSLAFCFALSVGLLVVNSTGSKDAGTVVSDASVGTQIWSNPSNATASNNTYADAQSQGAADTQYLKATNFGFSIPTNSTIDGIQPEVERSSLAQLTSDLSVRLVKGGTVQGQDLAGSGAWGSTDFVEIYGGPTNLWGLTLTPTDVNATNFGFVIQAHMSGQDSASIDVMSMTVFYSINRRIFIISKQAGKLEPMEMHYVQESEISNCRLWQ